jgi:catechol 2,3-dioxygenase-like lactoylglutathione lyase family enzyme
MDWSLEVVVLPVSDIDGSLAFYRDQVGFHLDHDTCTDEMHVVQLTPPGSGCSIVFGDLPSQNQMQPRSMKALQLVVSDAARARQELLDRGVEVSDLMVVSEADGATFFGFQDPDGSSWAVQEIKARAENPLIPNDHTGLREWAER